MKIAILKAGCLLVLSGAATHAQTYSIDWFTIDGGGGTRTGGVYSATGKIGQPDAGGPMTNGLYSELKKLVEDMNQKPKGDVK
jgi:hypothetical protein